MTLFHSKYSLTRASLLFRLPRVVWRLEHLNKLSVWRRLLRNQSCSQLSHFPLDVRTSFTLALHNIAHMPCCFNFCEVNTKSQRLDACVSCVAWQKGQSLGVRWGPKSATALESRTQLP